MSTPAPSMTHGTSPHGVGGHGRLTRDVLTAVAGCQSDVAFDGQSVAKVNLSKKLLIEKTESGPPKQKRQPKQKRPTGWCNRSLCCHLSGELVTAKRLPEVAHFCKEIIVALWAWLNGSDFNCLDVAG